MRLNPLFVLFAALSAIAATSAPAQGQGRRPLTPGDIDAITHLVRLEDTRQFDEPELGRLLKAAHPEVRRRAVLAVGRIAHERGRSMLVSMRAERDADILATVVFATGQLKDSAAVAWLANLLASPGTPGMVAREAACALGKIRTPEARAVLAFYLSAAPPSASPAVVGEALLAIGRFTTKDDVAPIARWATSRDVEIRWRAAWALFRPRNPDAVRHLLPLVEDGSAEVRVWAVRGLTPAVVDPSGIERARTSALLRAGVRDADRRIRTESLRTLGLYDDDESFAVVAGAVDSPDTWLSVSAAEALARFKDRAAVVVPTLVVAAGADKPTALRVTALAGLVALAPDPAVDVAAALMRSQSAVARSAAAGALQRLGEAGQAKLTVLAADPEMKALLPPLPATRPAGGSGGTAANARPPVPTRPVEDYRRVVERWIVPDYNGAPRPRAVWDTPRGPIELELYPSDAPLAVDDFVRLVESGAVVGTEFGRVVPDFVAQQRTIPGAVTLRDEVSRRGLTRANLSWASSGLDTGRPGYTLGSTPQPHNEGDFTALGRVVNGMDVVDRLELGDAVTAARMK